MVQVNISNGPACVGYSPGLATSCVSLTFWTAHEILSGPTTPTVSYCVTVPTPEFVFTTTVECYVCDGMEFDLVLGQDFDRICQDNSGKTFGRIL